MKFRMKLSSVTAQQNPTPAGPVNTAPGNAPRTDPKQQEMTKTRLAKFSVVGGGTPEDSVSAKSFSAGDLTLTITDPNVQLEQGRTYVVEIALAN